MKLDGLLHGITSLIVSACDPEKIVLFGSYAKGMQNADSDLDILVIGNFQGSRFLLGQELQQLLHGYPMHIDLHVATPWEVDAESMKPFGFLSSVLASGVVLYLSSPSSGAPSHLSRDRSEFGKRGQKRKNSPIPVCFLGDEQTQISPAPTQVVALAQTTTPGLDTETTQGYLTPDLVTREDHAQML